MFGILYFTASRNVQLSALLDRYLCVHLVHSLARSDTTDRGRDDASSRPQGTEAKRPPGLRYSYTKSPAG